MLYTDLGLPGSYSQDTNPYNQPRRRPPQQAALASVLQPEANELPPLQGRAPQSAQRSAQMPAQQAVPRAQQPAPGGRPNPNASAATALEQSLGGGAPQGAPSQPYGMAGARLQDAYRQYLGREGSPQELGSHINYGRAADPRGVQYGLNSIMNSPEAQAYAARPQEPEAPQAPVPGGPGGYEAQFRSIMQPFGYGPEALMAAQEALRAAGFDLQIDSANRGRGRIKDPSGQIIDVYGGREGTTADNNWFNGLQDTDWGWQSRGYLPEGGWSFDGGGGGGADAGSGGAGAWNSRNQQMGGDALQVIYQMLGPLMAQMFQGEGLKQAIDGDPR
jgi:hypothetical protein